MAFKMRNPLKQAKTSGFGPSTAFGGSGNPELTKSKTSNKKVMTDGPKNTVHGAGKTGNWSAWQFNKRTQ